MSVQEQETRAPKRAFRFQSEATRASHAAASKNSWNDPGRRARRSAGIKAGRERRQRVIASLFASKATPAMDAVFDAWCRRQHDIVPVWLPASLVPTFIELAFVRGDVEAAAHCRRLKREMER